MNNRELNIEGTPILSRIISAVAMGIYHVFVFEGGSRSSKTYSIIQFFIQYALTNQDKPNRVVIARKRATWLQSTVWNDFKTILMSLGLLRYCRINNTLKIIRLGTTTFEFIGLDEVQKLHGLTTDIVWINEAMEATKDDFDQLEQRTTRFSILDYNPSAEEHWIYDTVCPRPDCYFDHSTMLDNPFIPENSRRKILSYEPTEENYANGTVDIRKWKIYGLGLRATIEGLVFSNWEIIDSIPPWVTKRWNCLDFGFTTDPTAAAEVGFYKNCLYIDERFYQTDMLTRDIIKAGKTRCKPLEFICESADPRLEKELRQGGLKTHKVKKYQGSVEAGIDFMKSCQKIYITAQSLNTIKEFKNYTYQQDADGKWLNDPVDDYNHIIDGVRYVCLERLMGKPRTAKRKTVPKGTFR